jgi:hypothetical protein
MSPLCFGGPGAIVVTIFVVVVVVVSRPAKHIQVPPYKWEAWGSSLNRVGGPLSPLGGLGNQPIAQCINTFNMTEYKNRDTAACKGGGVPEL